MTMKQKTLFMKFIQSHLDVNDKKAQDLKIQKSKIVKDNELGLPWAVVRLTKISHPELMGCTKEQEAVVKQWLQFALHDIGFLDVDENILKEINDVLSDKVYLLGNCFSIADVAVSYVLMTKLYILSLAEKEKYIHLSRWFNHLQNSYNIYTPSAEIKFSRSLLFD